MKIVFLTLTITLTLGGCATLDKINTAIEEYCSITSNSITKRVAIGVIRGKYPLYPEEGICTELNDDRL